MQLFAQNKQLESANALFEDKSYVLAIEEYEKILERDVDPEAMVNLALSYWALRKGEKSEQWFEVASLNGGFERTNEYFSPDLIYTYAEVLKFNGKYKNAQEQFLEYESVTGDSKGVLQAKICTIIPVLMRDSSKVEMKAFQYNSENAEFAPQLNDETLYFVGSVGKVSESNIDNYTGEPYLDIIMSKYPGTDSAEAPKALNKRINSSLNEGPLTFSRSGEKIIFTRNYFGFFNNLF
jgi:tetratricopeptide (TPR) repeat protein